MNEFNSYHVGMEGSPSLRQRKSCRIVDVAPQDEAISNAEEELDLLLLLSIHNFVLFTTIRFATVAPFKKERVAVAGCMCIEFGRGMA